MIELTPEERMRTVVLFPEWGYQERVTRAIRVSDELRTRLRVWNDLWQTDLDPVEEGARWSDPEVGRQWIAEGNALVIALRAEIDPSIRVVGDFEMYGPDAYPAHSPSSSSD